MPQSPISFKSVFSSLAASLLINGAALYIFVLHFHANKPKNTIKNNSINVMLVDTEKPARKPKNSTKKHPIKVLHKYTQHFKYIKPHRQTTSLHRKQVAKIEKHTKPKIRKLVMPTKKKKRKLIKKIVIHKKIILHKKRYAKKEKHKAKIERLISMNIPDKKTKSMNLEKQTEKSKSDSKNSITLNKSTGYFKINISKKSYTGIFLWISKHKFYPMEAIYKEEEGKIGLIFFIDSSGLITNIDIEKPSKYKVLNEAAIEIVQNSSPIPKTLLSSISRFPAKAKVNIVFNIE